jgi:hypothetical protein
MTDTKFFKLMGALQFFIAFINFYVAGQSWTTPGLLNLAVGALCLGTGVFCTVLATKLCGWID